MSDVRRPATQETQFRSALPIAALTRDTALAFEEGKEERMTDYEALPIDELFAAYRAAAIREYELKAGPDQLRAIDVEAQIVREIHSRGDVSTHMWSMSTDEHPAVRLRAAIGLERYDAPAAMRLFRELIHSRAVSGVPSTALDEYMALERRGIKEI